MAKKTFLFNFVLLFCWGTVGPWWYHSSSTIKSFSINQIIHNLKLSTFIKKSNIPRFNEKLIICEFKQLYLHIIFQNRLIYQLLSVILSTECFTLSSKKMHDTICKVKLLNVSFLATNTSKPKDFQLQHTVD